MANKVQEQCLSEPVQVAGLGAFRFRAHTIYEERQVLVRAAVLQHESTTGPDTVPGVFAPALANYCYMLAALETGLAEVPDGFSLNKIYDPDVVHLLFQELVTWRRQFRGGVPGEPGPVGV